jgi:hypothetical protein
MGAGGRVVGDGGAERDGGAGDWGVPLGLLLNFGGATFKEGVRRVVNGQPDFAGSRLRVNRPHR